MGNINNRARRGSMLVGYVILFLLVISFIGCEQATKTQVESTTPGGKTTEPKESKKPEELLSPVTTAMPTTTPISEFEEAKEVIAVKLQVEEGLLEKIVEDYGEEVVLSVAKDIGEGTYSTNSWIRFTKKSLFVLVDEYKGILSSEASRREHNTYVVGDGTLSKEKVTVTFAGDVNFSENWSTTRYLDKQKNGVKDCFSSDLLKAMVSVDLFMLNNEYTYSTGGEPLKNKKYTFRAKPERVKNLNTLGVDLVSLANNHAYDYGEEALIDTMDTLTEAGIPYVGAGRDLEEAMKPVYYIINGGKIAFVSATQIERSTLYTKEATETSAGVLRTKDPTKFVSVIEEAKKNSDLVMVYVHWGTEHEEYIDGTQRPLANAFIDAGADLIIGAHTHCLQGIEYYKGVPIVYSLGNYWFNSRTLDTGLMEVSVAEDGELGLKFLPCNQKKHKTSLVTKESEKKRILNHLEEISYHVSIDDEGVISNNR